MNIWLSLLGFLSGATMAVIVERYLSLYQQNKTNSNWIVFQEIEAAGDRCKSNLVAFNEHIEAIFQKHTEQFEARIEILVGLGNITMVLLLAFGVLRIANKISNIILSGTDHKEMQVFSLLNESISYVCYGTGFALTAYIGYIVLKKRSEQLTVLMAKKGVEVYGKVLDESANITR